MWSAFLPKEKVNAFTYMVPIQHLYGYVYNFQIIFSAFRWTEWYLIFTTGKAKLQWLKSDVMQQATLHCLQLGLYMDET